FPIQISELCYLSFSMMPPLPIAPALMILLLAGPGEPSRMVVAQESTAQSAVPTPPRQDEFAPGPMTPGELPVSSPPLPATIEPGEMTAPANKPIVTKPADQVVPTGATISEMQSQSRVIEDARLERIQVYPDDPESAWWEINP